MISYNIKGMSKNDYYLRKHVVSDYVLTESVCCMHRSHWVHRNKTNGDKVWKYSNWYY